jgi:hypothetical protein
MYGIGHSTYGLNSTIDYVIQNPIDVIMGADIRTPKSFKIATERNENVKLGNETSVKLVGNFTTNNSYNSPMFNISTFSMICIANKIDYMNEANLNTTPVPYGRYRYINESYPNALYGGARDFKYLSNMVSLKNSAFDLIVVFECFKPQYADFEIWVKFVSSELTVDTDTIPFIEIKANDMKQFTSTSINNKEVVRILVSDYTEIKQFRAYQVKLIGKSKDPSKPVVFKNIRSVALT